MLTDQQQLAEAVRTACIEAALATYDTATGLMRSTPVRSVPSA